MDGKKKKNNLYVSKKKKHENGRIRQYIKKKKSHLMPNTKIIYHFRLSTTEQKGI